jgi:hypothetical protein
LRTITVRLVAGERTSGRMPLSGGAAERAEADAEYTEYVGAGLPQWRRTAF